jgi:penicillin-binding protein 2
MNLNFGERNWGIGDLMSLGVGQGMVSVSPLQMAVAVSLIANGGYRVQPHLVKEIHHSNNSVNYTQPYKELIDWIKPADLTTVGEGMRQVVSEGSSRYYTDIEDIPTAGKTGTSQNPHGQDHGWFIAFAPYDNPQIAIAVLTENSGYGSISAAPIASLLIEKYLSGEVNRSYVMNYVLNFEPRPLEDEEDEADENSNSEPAQEDDSGTEINDVTATEETND